jgi:preprotein translocase subunit SecF
MKKRLLPAISIGIAILVIGSLAYAMDKKKNTKATGKFADEAHDDALQSELLNALENQEKSSAESSDSKKIHIKAPDKDKATLTAESTKK